MKTTKAILGQDGFFSAGNFGSHASVTDNGRTVVRNFKEDDKVTKDLKAGKEVYFTLQGDTLVRTPKSKISEYTLSEIEYQEQLSEQMAEEERKIKSI
jgi:predicted RNA binding protein YcfA (HicA-like mRNA interferase family)